MSGTARLLLAVVSLLAPLAQLQAGSAAAWGLEAMQAACQCCPQEQAPPAPVCVDATTPSCCCASPSPQPAPAPVVAPSRLASGVDEQLAHGLEVVVDELDFSEHGAQPRADRHEFAVSKRVPLAVRTLLGVRLI